VSLTDCRRTAHPRPTGARPPRTWHAVARWAPRLLWCALTSLALVREGSAAPARERNDLRPAPAAAEPAASRLIVGLRDGSAAQAAAAKVGAHATAEALRSIARRAGLPGPGRAIGGELGTIDLAGKLSGTALQDAIARVAEDPGVEFVQGDGVKHPHALSNDPLAGGQWFLGVEEVSAIRATDAWETTQGSDGIVVAVLDTGVLFDHADLGWAAAGGRLLPGYDFVGPDGDGRFLRANDGDGRDANPWDPGDWIDGSDTVEDEFAGCSTDASSWHGTRVSGLIAALTNNGVGVAGVSWRGWVLPVRVLGKCGGNDSDILAAMRWAGGLSVDGVPDNPHPARIINLSLGSSGATCSAAYQSVISQLVSRGVLVVVSAGNDGSIVSEPANCNGALAVAAVRHAGTKVGFSNLGDEVAISAPGGNCVNTGAGEPCLFSIDTTSNDGTAFGGSNTYTNQLDFNVGTSFSAPLVSGAAVLALATNARLSPATLRARLREGAAPFPANTDPEIPECRVPAGPGDLQTAECSCTTLTCGAGLLNASGAVQAAVRPIAVPRAAGPVTAGQEVTLDGSGSVAACGRNIAAYSWALVDDDSGAAIVGADQPIATVTAPASGTMLVRLAVTDDQGATDNGEITLTANSAFSSVVAPLAGDACPAPITIAAQPAPEPDGPPTDDPDPPPASSGGGGGGGGAIGSSLLLWLACAGLVARRARRVASG
jgi:serine protease